MLLNGGRGDIAGCVDTGSYEGVKIELVKMHSFLLSRATLVITVLLPERVRDCLPPRRAAVHASVATFLHFSSFFQVPSAASGIENSVLP